MNNILLDLLALGAIVSGIMVITAKNPVIFPPPPTSVVSNAYLISPTI